MGACMPSLWLSFCDYFPDIGMRDVNGTGRLKDKIAMVTGGARGLGRSMPWPWPEGACVAVVDICRTLQEST